MIELAYVARFVLATTFLLAGLAKIGRSDSLTLIVTRYGVPPLGARLVAKYLPVFELSLAGALYFGVALAVSSALSGIVLLAFAMAVGLNLSRGRVFDCGCGVALGSRAISWQLVTVDCVLAGAGAVLAAVNPAGDALLSGPWHSSSGDHVSVAASFIVGTLIVLVASLMRETVDLRAPQR